MKKIEIKLLPRMNKALVEFEGELLDHYEPERILWSGQESPEEKEVLVKYFRNLYDSFVIVDRAFLPNEEEAKAHEAHGRITQANAAVDIPDELASERISLSEPWYFSLLQLPSQNLYQICNDTHKFICTLEGKKQALLVSKAPELFKAFDKLLLKATKAGVSCDKTDRAMFFELCIELLNEEYK
jgi:hypothetical protein